MVAGKTRKPRCSKNIINNFPIDYTGNSAAWFTKDLISDLFNSTHQEIYSDQTQRQITIADVKSNLIG